MTSKQLDTIGMLLAAFGVWLLFAGGGGVPGLTTKATAAVYVYEANSGGVPPAITRALGKLNEKGIIAATHEDDDTNIPAQYKLAVPAAHAAGLPAFVSLAGDKPLRTISKPTEAQVLEAVP